MRSKKSEELEEKNKWTKKEFWIFIAFFSVHSMSCS